MPPEPDPFAGTARRPRPVAPPAAPAQRVSSARAEQIARAFYRHGREHLLQTDQAESAPREWDDEPADERADLVAIVQRMLDAGAVR